MEERVKWTVIEQHGEKCWEATPLYCDFQESLIILGRLEFNTGIPGSKLMIKDIHAKALPCNVFYDKHGWVEEYDSRATEKYSVDPKLLSVGSYVILYHPLEKESQTHGS